MIDCEKLICKTFHATDSCHLFSRYDGLDLLRTIQWSTFTSGPYPESIDSRHLSSRSDGSDLLRMIWRSTFTSGLSPKSIDSCHLSSGSDGSDLLRTIRRSMFTSGLYLESIDSPPIIRIWRFIFTSDDPTVDIYFGSLPKIHIFGPPILRI